jgi:hypothetical protein
MLSSNKESIRAFKQAIGKTIVDLGIKENKLVFTFDTGLKMALYDNGQSCCEHRYMHTDDKLSDFIGATFQDAEVRAGGRNEIEEYEDVLDSEFLIITTSKGQFTIVNYNEHNGYYGGFAIEAKIIAS